MILIAQFFFIVDISIKHLKKEIYYNENFYLKYTFDK